MSSPHPLESQYLASYIGPGFFSGWMTTSEVKPVKPKTALDWLLDEDQPSIRYLALTQLLGRAQDDPEVQSAKQMISKIGWAADIIAKQMPSGSWVDEERLYVPKYVSTNWMLLILSDLGLTKENPQISKACELWIRRFAKRDGGFGAEGWSKSRL